MSEFQFGLGPGHLPKSANTVAQKHGARLVNYTEPRGLGGEKRHWFSGPNHGAPHDEVLAKAVLTEIEAKAIPAKAMEVRTRALATVLDNLLKDTEQHTMPERTGIAMGAYLIRFATKRRLLKALEYAESKVK